MVKPVYPQNMPVIIICSGYLDQNIFAEGEQQGINYFLEKPIKNEVFQLTLYKLIKQQLI